MRIALAIMDELVRRYQEVTSAESKRREAALSRWRETIPYVHEADESYSDEIVAAYRSTVIPVQRLLALAGADPELASQARIDIENEGGFLHDQTPDLRPYLRPRGVTKYLRGDRGELNGFYTVACDTGEVRQMVGHDLGWQEGVLYDETNLPASSETGMLEWTNKAQAAELFNNTDQLALPGDLVILPRRLGRNVGWGKGLKVETYRELADSFPQKKWTLTRIFEITKINGLPLQDPVANVWSRHMNITNLRASHIGTLTERFRRETADGPPADIEVNWWLLRSRIAGLLEQAER